MVLSTQEDSMTTQEISDNDVILVSDSGAMYVVKMTESGDATGASIEPLADVFQPGAQFLVDSGVAVANMPHHAFAGGITCVLVNLKSLRQRSSGG
jgi:hypothetical protein